VCTKSLLQFPFLEALISNEGVDRADPSRARPIPFHLRRYMYNPRSPPCPTILYPNMGTSKDSAYNLCWNSSDSAITDVVR
jgi:hypothetical protein